MAELDIAAFLRTRYDEDERVAKAADEIHGYIVIETAGDHSTADVKAAEDFVNHYDPAFALADVAAKRRILALHEPTFPPDGPIHGVHWEHVHVRGANGEIIGDREFAVENDEPDPPDWCGQCAEGRCAPCPTLRLLALLYSGHPDYRDYREEWKP